MRRLTLTVGLLILLGGVYVAMQGTQILIPIAQVTGFVSRGVSVTPIMSSTLLSVPGSNYTYLTADLKENVQVTGILQVEGGGEIGFYVMNEGNFSLWRHGYPSMTELARPIAINYNFTFVPSESGVYYFVFSNEEQTHKNIIFDLNVVEFTPIISPLVQYADFGMMLFGFLLVIVGAKTGRKHPPVPKCKFCGKRLASGETFCSKCGRSQD